MNSKERAALVAKAHNLNPVVSVGQKGVSDALLAEADVALNAHELIKVKFSTTDRGERQQQAELLCSTLSADLLKIIGKIAVIYRQNAE